jgi:hypothetical protein
MTTWLSVLLAANLAALAVTLFLYRRMKKAQTKRRVEAPNSQYKSPYVLDLEAKERWQAIDLDRLHEVNREEVEKLLAKLALGNVRMLTASERAFLDRMVEAEARVRARARAAKGDGPRVGPGRPRQLPGTP